jgi:cytochrome c oxidase assembly factor CtaG/putative copper export protein
VVRVEAQTVTRSGQPVGQGTTDASAAEPTSRGWIPWPYAVAVCLLAGASLVIALRAGGGAPQPVPVGLPDAGSITGWGLPLARLTADLAGMVAIGALLSVTWLLSGSAGGLTRSGVASMRMAGVASLVAALAAMVEIELTLSDFLGIPLDQSLGLTPTWSFMNQTPQGRTLLVQALLSLVVGLTARLVTTRAGAAILLLAATAALASPALTGHSATASDHMTGVSSLLIHIVAVAWWVGGLIGIGLVVRYSRTALPNAVSRFSSLAAGCYVTVLVSGVVNAWLRIGSFRELFGSSYGHLVLAKSTALVVLGAIGWQHRRRTIPALRAGGRRAFLRLAAGEVALMAATVGLAVGLARSPTPTPATAETAASQILGFPMPDSPTVGRLLFDVRLDGFILFPAILAGVFYLRGVRTLRRRGDSWPPGRTAAWLSGLAIIVAVTCSGLGRYAAVMFSAHMVQHMALNMVAPLLLVLGAPITLSLRALPTGSPDGGLRAGLVRILHSLPVRILTHPLVASALFIGSVYGLYFSSLFEMAMGNHWGHLVMQLHFVLVGSLFFWSLVGVDPGPRRPPYPLRLLLMLMATGLHALFAVALLSSNTVIASGYYHSLHRPWGDSLLDDQHLGAGIGWAFGEVPIVAVCAILFVQWWRHDQREAAAVDRELDRTSA